MAAIFHYLLPFHCFVNMKVVKILSFYNKKMQNKIGIKIKTEQ